MESHNREVNEGGGMGRVYLNWPTDNLKERSVSKIPSLSETWLLPAALN